MQLALTDLFRAKWTKDIHAEWIEALLRNEPNRERASLESTRDLMDQSTRDGLVDGYQGLIPSLKLPDENDRHVLAAAIVGRCDVIVTKNLKHFPAKALEVYGIEAQDPDNFLLNLLDLTPGIFCGAIKKVRARLKNPPYSVQDYLNTLRKQGLIATVAQLEQFSEAI